MKKPAYKRILLKLSGETLKGAAPFGVDPDTTVAVAKKIGEITAAGVQVALVIGAGNLFRGLPASKKGMTRATADKMGMLATVMNALAMGDCLESVGVPAVVQCAIPMPGVAEVFERKSALAHLEAGKVVILAGGTGHPFFTTDTTAALRACEIEACAVLKATKVNGIYTADPMKDAAAKRYRTLSYADALAQRLEVMDATAFSLCRENNIPILVFNFFKDGDMLKVVMGDSSVATVVGSGATVLD